MIFFSSKNMKLFELKHLPAYILLVIILLLIGLIFIIAKFMPEIALIIIILPYPVAITGFFYAMARCASEFDYVDSAWLILIMYIILVFAVIMMFFNYFRRPLDDKTYNVYTGQPIL